MITYSETETAPAAYILWKNWVVIKFSGTINFRTVGEYFTENKNKEITFEVVKFMDSSGGQSSKQTSTEASGVMNQQFLDAMNLKNDELRRYIQTPNIKSLAVKYTNQFQEIQPLTGEEDKQNPHLLVHVENKDEVNANEKQLKKDINEGVIYYEGNKVKSKRCLVVYSRGFKNSYSINTTSSSNPLTYCLNKSRGGHFMCKM